MNNPQNILSLPPPPFKSTRALTLQNKINNARTEQPIQTLMQCIIHQLLQTFFELSDLNNCLLLWLFFWVNIVIKLVHGREERKLEYQFDLSACVRVRCPFLFSWLLWEHRVHKLDYSHEQNYIKQNLQVCYVEKSFCFTKHECFVTVTRIVSRYMTQLVWVRMIRIVM